MIRIVVSMEIQQGRSVRPIKPLLSWELIPGMKLTLPTELESNLIREGLAEQDESAAVFTQAEGK